MAGSAPNRLGAREGRRREAIRCADFARGNSGRPTEAAAQYVLEMAFVATRFGTSRLRSVLVVLAALVGAALLSNLGQTPYDDGYFFERFARHILEHGSASWNVADGPVYGITSQAFLVVATAIAAIAPNHTVLVTKLVLAACAWLAGAFLALDASRLTTRPDDGAALTLVAFSTPLVLVTVHTGMETAFALLAVVVALRAVAANPQTSVATRADNGDKGARDASVDRRENARRVAPPAHGSLNDSLANGSAPGHRAPYAARAAAATLVVYLCRPDAAIIPAVVFVVAHRRESRRVVAYVASLAFGLGATCLAFRAYYGTALPLPFYAKVVHGGVDPAVAGAALRSKALHLATFAALSAPLGVASWFGRRDPRGLPFFVATVAFVLYHATLTHEIMGYHARFYLPAVVPLTLAAAAGWDALAARWTARPLIAVWLAWGVVAVVLSLAGVVAGPTNGASESVAPIAYVVPAFMVALMLANGRIYDGLHAVARASGRAHDVESELGESRRSSSVPGVANDTQRDDRAAFFLHVALLAVPLLALRFSVPCKWPHELSDRRFLARSSAEVTTVRGLDDVARCLPDVHTLYHSEIGVPGLVLPNARIVDFAGLMSKDIAFGHASFDELCLRDRPEAIFLPHKNYVRQNREVTESRCLRAYSEVVRRSSSPLYVRSDLAPRFLSCATSVARWQ